MIPCLRLLSLGTPYRDNDTSKSTSLRQDTRVREGGGVPGVTTAEGVLSTLTYTSLDDPESRGRYLVPRPQRRIGVGTV